MPKHTRLSARTVLAIRNKIALGMPDADLAQLYRVSVSTINRIRNKKSHHDPRERYFDLVAAVRPLIEAALSSFPRDPRLHGIDHTYSTSISITAAQFLEIASIIYDCSLTLPADFYLRPPEPPATLLSPHT